MSIPAMYRPIVDTACQQAKRGIRDISIHDDSQVEVNILPGGRIEVKLFDVEAGSLDEWGALCVRLAETGSLVISEVMRRVTFIPA